LLVDVYYCSSWKEFFILLLTGIWFLLSGATIYLLKCKNLKWFLKGNNSKELTGSGKVRLELKRHGSEIRVPGLGTFMINWGSTVCLLWKQVLQGKRVGIWRMLVHLGIISLNAAKFQNRSLSLSPSSSYLGFNSLPWTLQLTMSERALTIDWSSWYRF
jgi:hypothetical protein